MPSAVNPLPDWKSLTAASVAEPKFPSMRSKDRIFISTSRRCSRLTSGPADPLRINGPLFIETSPSLNVGIYQHWVMVGGSSAETDRIGSVHWKRRPNMLYFAGLDVSMAETHVCVVTENGAVIH